MSAWAAGVSAAADVAGLAIGARQNRQNLRHQREVHEYQKRLQERLFAREDNAVQRRAADLEAAGLSKTLAAGSAAPAGGVVGTTAPQHTRDLGRQVADIDALNLMKMKEEVGVTAAQKRLLVAQAEKARTESGFVEAMQPHRLTEIQLQNDVNHLLNPMRVRRLGQDIASGEIRVRRDEIAEEAERLGVTNREIDIVRNGLGADLDRLNLSLSDQRLMAAIVANDLARLNLAARGYDIEYNIGRGHPTTGGTYGGLVGGVTQALQQASSMLEHSFGPSPLSQGPLADIMNQIFDRRSQ